MAFYYTTPRCPGCREIATIWRPGHRKIVTPWCPGRQGVLLKCTQLRENSLKMKMDLGHLQKDQEGQFDKKKLQKSHATVPLTECTVRNFVTLERKFCRKLQVLLLYTKVRRFHRFLLRKLVYVSFSKIMVNLLLLGFRFVEYSYLKAEPCPG